MSVSCAADGAFGHVLTGKLPAGQLVTPIAAG